MSNIIYVIKIIIIINNYIKRLFFFVIDLKYYSIVLDYF